jgi:hypothetical protein
LEEEQLRIIHKLTDLENSLRRGLVYWKNRELLWCCSIAKLEEIIKRIETGEQLELRYFCSAVLALGLLCLAKERVTVLCPWQLL